HGRPLTELFPVDPARRAVLDPILFTPVGRDSGLTSAVGVAHPEVSIAIEGLLPAVWRRRRIELPSALGSSGGAAPSGPAAPPAGRCLGGADLRRRAGRYVEAIAFAVVEVLEGPAVRTPRDAQRSQPD